MGDEDKRKLQLNAEQSAKALPVLVLLLAVLGLWMLVAGVLRLYDDARAKNLQHSRDDVVAGLRHALQDEQRRFADRLSLPAVKEALAQGDQDAARKALASEWSDVKRIEFWPVDLRSAYEGLPRSGYGSLAVVEAAVAAGKPAARVVMSRGEQRLALATHAGDEQAPLLAYVELPLSRLTLAFDTAHLGSGTYLALRQGSRSLQERGDTGLSNMAESMAARVEDSDLRVAAAVPNETQVPFGQNGWSGLVSGTLLLVAALALWFVLRPRLLGGSGAGEEELALTLAHLERIQRANEREQEQAAPPRPKPEPKPEPKRVEIERGIFRAYDIRGVVGQTLDAGVAELIGQAIGSLMHDKGMDDIVVGRDGRLSGPDLVEGLIAGLRKSGRNVIDIGMVPTPVVYFGCYHLRTGCGVAVTGSHNPPDHNGFKIVVAAETLSGEAIADLYARIAEDRLLTARKEGGLSVRDISEDYVQRISGDIQIATPLKVVVDAGNGVAGELGPRVLEAIGANITPLFCEIDGTFPNHHPDPSEPHNLDALVQMVKRLDADLGVAFDGDGDRLGVVTKAGKIVFPDRLLMLFAGDVLQRNPGAMIVYDVKCTGRLAAQVLRHGGSPLMWKTGHSLIKAKMRETGAELAGEMSGHFFFSERWYGFDDGIYAAARLLEILDASGQSPDEVFDALPDGVSTSEIKVDAPEGDPHAFVERFRESSSFDGARVTTIDGVRVDWPDGWGLVRASNTTSVLVMRFDADSHEAMARIQLAFREKLLALRPDLDLPF